MVEPEAIDIDKAFGSGYCLVHAFTFCSAVKSISQQPRHIGSYHEKINLTLEKRSISLLLLGKTLRCVQLSNWDISSSAVNSLWLKVCKFRPYSPLIIHLESLCSPVVPMKFDSLLWQWVQVIINENVLFFFDDREMTIWPQKHGLCVIRL